MTEEDRATLRAAVEHAPKVLPPSLADYLARDFANALGWMDSFAECESLPAMVSMPLKRAREVLAMPSAPDRQGDEDKPMQIFVTSDGDGGPGLAEITRVFDAFDPDRDEVQLQLAEHWARLGIVDMGRAPDYPPDEFADDDTIVFRAAQSAVDFLLDKIAAARGLVGGTPTADASRDAVVAEWADTWDGEARGPARPVVGVDIAPPCCGNPDCRPHHADARPCGEYAGDPDEFCPACGWHERHHRAAGLSVEGGGQ